MSVILTRSNSHGGRKTSLAEAGPYVHALLARERVVMLEWEAPDGGSMRREGRLLPGTRPGDVLAVELHGHGAAGRPQAGAPVTLVLPMQDTLWRFTTAGREREKARAGGDVVSLEWPVEAVEEAARRHDRAPFMLPVIATLPDSARGAVSIATYTLDVSIGGVQLVLPRPLHSGAALQLAIRLPQETVTVGATVAWARPVRDEPGDPLYSAGVRFTALAPRVATRLRTLLVTRGATPG
ncbi:MAG TPA: PilZ domain-containing protein [Gemmatimonadales bacterium]